MEHFPLSLHSFSPFLRLNLIVLYLSKQGMEAVLITRNSTTDNQGNLTTSDQRLEVNLAGKVSLPSPPFLSLRHELTKSESVQERRLDPGNQSNQCQSLSFLSFFLSLSLSLLTTILR